MEELSNGDYIFQQDGTRSHTSKVTVTYLEEHFCTFLKPDFWPPNTPDLNPCDYAIWGTLEAKIWRHNRFQITSLEDLKERIVKEWDALLQDVISRAISSFRKRVRMVIKKNGRHIENIFRRTSNIFIRFNYWFILVRKKSSIFHHICFFFNFSPLH